MADLHEILSKHAARRRALLMKTATTAPAVSFLLGASLPAQAQTYGGSSDTTAFDGDSTDPTFAITPAGTTTDAPLTFAITPAGTTTNSPLTFAITPAGTTTNSPLTFAITPAGTTTNSPLTFAITPASTTMSP